MCVYTTSFVPSKVYTYTRMPPRLADHPQDERLHHTITRTDERFDLWRIIIILHILPSKVILLLSYYLRYILLRRYHLIWDKSIVYSYVFWKFQPGQWPHHFAKCVSRIASVGNYLLITTLESRYRTQTTSINGTRETDSHQKAAWVRLPTSVRRYIMSLEWVRLFTTRSIFFAMIA